MLIQLDIENVAVIKQASIEFDTGLNVITGETGAGKSLLINSLNMVLGSRSTRDIIREDADFAKVSAVFFCKEADSFLEEAGITTDEGNIIITRKLYRDGRNLCHINGNAVNVSLLKSVGEKLVVIHGQHDSNALMNTASHIHFLDAFAKNSDLLNEYKQTYHKLRDAIAQLEKLNSDEATRINEIDFLTYQTEEIEKAQLSANEEDELISRKRVLENSEAINDYARSSYSLLGGDSGVKDILYDVKRSLEKLSSIDIEAVSFSEKADELYYETEELAREVHSYLSSIEYNPSELERINDRLDIINTLKRKYNKDIPEILEFYESASERLCALKAFDENKENLEKDIMLLEEEAKKLASKLTNSRKESAGYLSDKLSEELNSLDMPKCVIRFALTPCPLCENGAEQVEFLISTNPSEMPKPLAKIASGGEISRVMLAIKSVFSDYDRIPTLLFDEIDTGVSGRAAEKIGLKMKHLSKNYQLISVTHLPVIASFADCHLVLEKNYDGVDFKTEIRKLSYSERINEIARIISGENISSISLENARQMLLLHNPDIKEEI